ncbi:MAG: hypothetical protein LHV69_03320 [Elusimicrobia bacterium]|nr:hypothetical protein [Candidatus Obscuribacterium magneticum]
MQKAIRLVIVAGLILLFAGLLVSTARQKSLVFDEVIYSAVGVLYWTTGNLHWNIIHPPLQKYISALPLLTQKLKIPQDLQPDGTDEWRAGYQLFFQSPTPAPRLLFLSRLPSILVTLLLGGVLFVVGWKGGRFLSGLLVLGVFSLDPLVLGNGSLAMNDIFVTAFFFFTVMAFYGWTQGKRGAGVGCGVLMGLTVLMKSSGLLLIPVILLLYGFNCRLLRRRKGSQGLGAMALIFLVAGVVIFAGYRFNGSLLMESLRAQFFLQTSRPVTGYLLGPISGFASWYYYPIALIIKTPLPLLLLWGFAIGVHLKKHRKDERFLFAFLPLLCIWGASLMSRNCFGVRYLLPATPFLAILVGGSLSLLKKRERIATVILMGWLMTETILVHPHHMAYFNELIGGPREGHKWLEGSNQDWGQDLPALATYLRREGSPTVLMGYWGSNDPGAWGIEYQDVLSAAIANAFRAEIVHPIDAKKEFLVVSARLRHDPSTRAAYQWLDQRKPIAFLGYTLFVYDVSHDAEAALNLADVYLTMGRIKSAKRQLVKALRTNPKIPRARELLKTLKV